MKRQLFSSSFRASEANRPEMLAQVRSRRTKTEHLTTSPIVPPPLAGRNHLQILRSLTESTKRLFCNANERSFRLRRIGRYGHK